MTTIFPAPNRKNIELEKEFEEVAHLEYEFNNCKKSL